ncbi:Dabb family protein [Phaeobacter sp. C3_T13_0]|uniref:Dabb family protein n=1 Tax=Phaeobacter cretensis TaxID=3342641 RepID=UPI0039BCF50B
MILHCVFFRFREDAPSETCRDVLSELATFARGLAGVLDFDAGPNRDFEGKSPNYSEGFVVRFSNRGALDHYAQHPAHQELGARLCDLCVGGADGIIVFDLETP